MEIYWLWHEKFWDVMDNSASSWQMLMITPWRAVRFHRWLRGNYEKWPNITDCWQGVLGTFTGKQFSKTDSSSVTVSVISYISEITFVMALEIPILGTDIAKFWLKGKNNRGRVEYLRGGRRKQETWGQ